jgi:hypothetical protein
MVTARPAIALIPMDDAPRVRTPSLSIETLPTPDALIPSELEPVVDICPLVMLMSGGSASGAAASASRAGRCDSAGGAPLTSARMPIERSPPVVTDVLVMLIAPVSVLATMPSESVPSVATEPLSISIFRVQQLLSELLDLPLEGDRVHRGAHVHVVVPS